MTNLTNNLLQFIYNLLIMIEVDDTIRQSSQYMVDRAIHFLKNRDKHRPFFCMMSIIDPHDPYENYPLEMRGFVDQLSSEIGASTT